jgi:hypothetical protein
MWGLLATGLFKNWKPNRFFLHDHISPGIVACFQTHTTMTLSLLQLAKVGLVLVPDFKDPAVEIVNKNLGGLVSRENSQTVGQPKSVRIYGLVQKRWNGLVPASESARLVMAEFVLYKGEERLGRVEEERLGQVEEERLARVEEERLARRWWRRLLFWRKKI